MRIGQISLRMKEKKWQSKSLPKKTNRRLLGEVTSPAYSTNIEETEK